MARLGLGLPFPLADSPAVMEWVLFVLIAGGLVLVVRWDKARQRRSWEEAAAYEDDDNGMVPPGYEEAAGPTRGGNRMAHLYVEGLNGQIEVNDEWVIIHRKGLLAKQGHAFGNKGIQIRLSDVHDIQISFPRLGKHGWLTFVTGSSGPVTDLMVAMKDPRTVMFKKKSQDDFDEFRQAIFDLKTRQSNDSMVQAIADGVAVATRPDFATQLRDLAALRDEGLLDEAEFQAKKAQLLSER
jgi:putative oligomerization/nucleic acid binding protein